MAYGVVACPKCRRAQLVELRFATAACRACRNRFDLKGRQLFHRGDDEEAARTALVKISAQLQGMGIEDYSRLLASLEDDQRGTLEEALAALGERGEFTSDDFTDEVQRRRVPGMPARLLERLRADNRIYEPRPGRFRVL